MTRTLVVVADRTTARLFVQAGTRGSLEPAGELDNPDGRKLSQEIDTDRPGRVASRSGGPPHALERHEPAHERAAADFARKIARHLEQARNDHVFDDVLLVAEPGFLGMLRGALDSVTAKHLRGSIAHDLSHVTAADLRARLEELLRP